MTRQFIREAVQQYLQNAPTPGLNQIWRAPVPLAQGMVAIPNGQPYGSWGYIWLATDVDTVRSTGLPSNIQPNGWSTVRYDCFLIFDWVVIQPNQTDDGWADALDVMIESVKTALRAGPTLGLTGSTILTSANNFPIDEAAITTVVEEPRLDPVSQNLVIHGAIDFPIIETVAPGGN